LVSRNKNSGFTIAWLLVIFVLPIVGYVLYVLWGRDISRSKRSKKTQAAIDRGMTFLEKDSGVNAEFGLAHPTRKRTSEYLLRNGFPLYKNTKSRYFSLGELQFQEMLKEMEQAQKFIFMEYFVVGSGELWDKFEDVLIRKAKQGVEIKLLFDDFGSIGAASEKIVNNLAKHGIEAIRFNPVHKSIAWLYANYRNHQKITVIDGNIGYTGGTNLADEYANLYQKHGHFKDTAIRLEGDAVWSLTAAFLQMWESESDAQMDYNSYRPSRDIIGDGFYQPFTDDPLNTANPAETSYRMIINNAKDYVYITSPYLIIDNTMMKALCSAAMSGCDVRIITPKIWDHWFVHMVTQSNYGELLKAGVKIYEYTPGYVHAKMIISDDDHAIIGSINMDYRSFYLHYENAVWFCGAPALRPIKEDIEELFDISEQIKLDDWLRRPIYGKCFQAVFRLFAVLF
jgi:cardiolipin synthase